MKKMLFRCRPRKQIIRFLKFLGTNLLYQAPYFLQFFYLSIIVFLCWFWIKNWKSTDSCSLKVTSKLNPKLIYRFPKTVNSFTYIYYVKIKVKMRLNLSNLGQLTIFNKKIIKVKLYSYMISICIQSTIHITKTLSLYEKCVLLKDKMMELNELVWFYD